MSLSSFIGSRLSFKQDSRSPSAGVVIAVTGIAISFTIMLLAISVVNGFRDEIVNKLSGFHPQITILPPLPQNNEVSNIKPITLDDTLRNRIKAAIPEAEIQLTISQPSMFKTDSTFQGIVIQGVAPGKSWNFIKSNLETGTVPSAENSVAESVVISRMTADALHVKTGDKVLTHFFDGNSLRSRKLLITGIYNSHFKDFDNNLAFSPVKMLQGVYEIDSITASSISLNGMELQQVPAKAEYLYQSLLAESMRDLEENGDSAGVYRVDNIYSQCAQYISWLNLLDTNVIVIIILMAFVSAFTLISSLFIIILERVNMIGLFKAIGATNRQIRGIFIFMAQRLVVRGLLIGNLLSIGAIFLQQHFHFLPLNPDAYYLNFVPMQLSPLPIIILNIAVIIIAYLILILPSQLISRISITKSIRYE
jgi:efflux ABC transporter, permease protein